jgi:hypothetical protein
LLAFTYLRRTIIEFADDAMNFVGIGFQEQIIDPYQHNITGKNGNIFIPFAMYSGFPPTKGSLVHDIVMKKGKIMEYLYGKRWPDYPLIIIPVKGVG